MHTDAVGIPCFCTSPFRKRLISRQLEAGDKDLKNNSKYLLQSRLPTIDCFVKLLKKTNNKTRLMKIGLEERNDMLLVVDRQASSANASVSYLLRMQELAVGSVNTESMSLVKFVDLLFPASVSGIVLRNPEVSVSKLL